MDFYITGDKVLLLYLLFLQASEPVGGLLDLQLRKQKHNCYFISTTAKFYVRIVQINGKTANAMSQLQMKCHN